MTCCLPFLEVHVIHPFSRVAANGLSYFNPIDESLRTALLVLSNEVSRVLRSFMKFHHVRSLTEGPNVVDDHSSLYVRSLHATRQAIK
jgi:hypothetical protein